MTRARFQPGDIVQIKNVITGTGRPEAGICLEGDCDCTDDQWARTAVVVEGPYIKKPDGERWYRVRMGSTTWPVWERRLRSVPAYKMLLP